MGKNRNSKKEQCQSYQVVSEDENCFQETETDFMTSDNFCIVQKRKHSKKTSDDVSQLPLSRFDLKSFSDVNAPTEDSNSHGFWKRKADEVAEQNSDLREAGEADEEFACLSSLSHSEFKLPGMMKDTAGNVESPVALFDATTGASDRQEASRSQVLSPECDSLECVSSNDVLQDESEENLIRNAIDSNGGETSQYRAEEKMNSKKKSDNSSKAAKKKKRKEHKVKLDEELEKLIKELDLDDTHKSKKNPANSLNPTETIEKSTVSTCKKRKKRNSRSLNNEILTSGCLIVDMNESSGGSMGIVNSDPGTAINGRDMENHVAESCNKKKKIKRSRDKQKSSIERDSPNSDVTESGRIKSEDKERVDDDAVPNAKEDLKKGCKNEETERKDKKKLGKKVLAVIQEALKKAKEEEDRLKSEEAAKKRAAEEAERARLEKLLLEQEKKEKKKLKERQRRERLKAEGRLLSKSQKQSRARIEATLAALRQQGVNIPQAGEKKPHGPRLGNDKTMNRRRCDSLQSNQGIDTQVTSNERTKSESLSSQESGKYSLSDLPSSFDSKDSWEISSMEESSALTAESGHLSCSEESDILDMDEPSDSHKEIINTKTNQIEKLDTTNHLNGISTNGISKDDKTKSVKLRSPIVCVLGHVDTGKTKILDFIRKTHVQDAEAGGITQQIGATMIPLDALKEKCKMVQNFSSLELRVPGLLVIDTPGHESFSNLRFRGSSICDIAILVVDIMHGLEPQTIESINLLKAGKTPFIVALNKVDRIYGWKSSKDNDIRKTIDSQSQAALAEFRKRCQNIILQFANLCINAALFYENNDPRSFVSMVPTSAISGDGIGNILGLIVQLTQSMLHKKLIFSNELQAIVLEVKAISGLGTTIDVILVNGSLRESDTIVLAGHDGPFVSQIRSLLMPQSLKELRVKNPYKEYKHVEGAQGVKISGRDLEKAIAGFPLYKADNNSKVDSIKSELNVLFGDYMNCIKTSERGVYVQASTLGSLEALLELLKSSDIPYFAVKIGPVVKKDVTKASIMLEHDNQYACILAFDVKVERDAQELADTLGVRIFHADIIYHLFDMYVQYREELRMKKVEEIKRSAVFPCKLKVLPEFVYSSKDPIILGVSVEAGTLKEGTPLCVPSRDLVEIGLVTSIKFNNKPVSSAKKGEEVCIKIEPKQGDSPKTYGKHFDHEDVLVSRITRPSIDVCKEFYRDELLPSDWQLMVELKKMLYIM